MPILWQSGAEKVSEKESSVKTADQLVEEVYERVQRTVAPTFGMNADGPTESLEGRITKVDLDTLISMYRTAGSKATAAERERCAQIHESINAACDCERREGHPGAGAMGAVIEYRDLIRTEAKRKVA